MHNPATSRHSLPVFVRDNSEVAVFPVLTVLKRRRLAYA
jgi:hypothetical protein